MRTLDRKLRRDLFRSKGILTAIAAIVAVGTGCFVGMLATYNNLDDARTRYYSQCRMADFWVELKKAPTAEVERLADIDGISDLRHRIMFPVTVDLENEIKLIRGLTLSLPPDPSPIINNIVIRRGGYFTSARRDEVIVSEKFAVARNISPGSFIHLILNGQRKELFVVGTATTSEFTYLTPPGNLASAPGDYGVFFIKREYAKDVFGFHGACNSVCGLFTPEADNHTGAVLDEVRKQLDRYGVFTTFTRKEQLSSLALSNELRGLQLIATILPLIFLGVAALVLNVLMARMAEQQRTTIGTLKALGYDNRQIFAHFLKYGLFVGALGGIAGCLLGQYMSHGMTNMYRTFFEFPRLVTDIYPALFIIALLIACGFSVVGTLRGARAVTRLSPAEAMRERPPATGGRVWLEYWPSLWRHLGFRWQLVLRSLFRNKVRTGVGLVAAALGTSIVLLAFGMNDAMKEMTSLQFDQILRSDYDLTLRDDVNEATLLEVSRLPGVIYVEPLLNVPGTFYNENHQKRSSITGLTPDSRLTVPRNTAGMAESVPSSGLLMSRRLADELGVHVGETVRFIPSTGLRLERDIPVVRIIDSVFGLVAYANINNLNRLIGERSAISTIQVKTQQTPETRREFLKQLKERPALEAVSNIHDQKGYMQDELVNQMKSMIFILIIFAAVIFFGSILNSSLIGIAERTREIATFRVLGYQPLDVGSLFLRENLMINLLGALLGLPLGWFLLDGMAKEFANDWYAMPSVIYPASWVWTLLLAAAFVVLAHIFVRRTMNRIHIVEAIALKE